MMLRGLRRALADPGVPRPLRFMARGFVRWPATVLAVILAGTVTYGQITRLSAEDFTRGTPGFGEEALVEPEGSPTVADESGPAATPRPGRSPTPGRPATPSSGGGGGNGTAGFAWSPPADGTYGYSVSGEENVNVAGPACSRRYRAGRITVRPFGDDHQLDTRYVNVDGSEDTHLERRIVNYSDSGVRIEYTEANVFCVKQNPEEADYDPPLLLFEFPLRVGNVWSSHAESQNRTSDLTGEVLRTETVTAAGQTFETYVVKTLITFTGNQEGRRSDTWWFSPSLGLPVRWEESTEARRGPATYRQHATWTLTSTP